MTAAGYSGTPLPIKLGIKDDSVFTVLHAPPGFSATLGDVGDAVWQHNLLPPLDVIVAFFTETASMIAAWPGLTEAVAPDGAVWVCWPKLTSKRPTDITENVLRDLLLPSGWVDNKVCAIDDTWSGLRFVLRKELRRGRRKGRS